MYILNFFTNVLGYFKIGESWEKVKILYYQSPKIILKLDLAGL